MPGSILVLLGAGWLAWVLPFFLVRRGKAGAQHVERRARWGILLQAVAYTILWQNEFWTRPPGPWRAGAGVVLLALAALLSWTSARTLGRQWRVDAGLNVDHRLVREGAYRFVRHPIYTSMLFMLLGTGCLVTPWWVVAVATVLFMIGTDIRVRIEDRLLAGRFGEQFREYQQQVAAYLPFVK